MTTKKPQPLAIRMWSRVVGTTLLAVNPSTPLDTTHGFPLPAAQPEYNLYYHARYKIAQAVWDWFEAAGAPIWLRRPSRSVGKSTSSPPQEAVRRHLQAFRNDLVASMAPVGARLDWQSMTLQGAGISFQLLTKTVIPRYSTDGTK
jgi:hypothetical protein